MKKRYFSMLFLIGMVACAMGAGPTSQNAIKNSHAFKQQVWINSVLYSPNSGMVMVQFNQNSPVPVTLGLFDAAGHWLANKTAADGRHSGTLFFDGSNLLPGKYILKLQNRDQNGVKAVIIVR
jgi:hypothetical protein